MKKRFCIAIIILCLAFGVPLHKAFASDFLNVPEWGIRFPIPNELSQVEYVTEKSYWDSNTDVLTITSVTFLDKQYTLVQMPPLSISEHIALGWILRYSGDIGSGCIFTKKTINGYSFCINQDEPFEPYNVDEIEDKVRLMVTQMLNSPEALPTAGTTPPPASSKPVAPEASNAASPKATKPATSEQLPKSGDTFNTVAIVLAGLGIIGIGYTLLKNRK